MKPFQKQLDLLSSDLCTQYFGAATIAARYLTILRGCWPERLCEGDASDTHFGFMVTQATRIRL